MKTNRLLFIFTALTLLTYNCVFAQADSSTSAKNSPIEIEYGKTAPGPNYGGASNNGSTYIKGFYVEGRFIKNNIPGRHELKKIILQVPLAAQQYKTHQVFNGIKIGSGLIFLGSGVLYGASFLTDDVILTEEVAVPVILSSGLVFILTHFVAKGLFKQSITSYNEHIKF